MQVLLQSVFDLKVIVFLLHCGSFLFIVRYVIGCGRKMAFYLTVVQLVVLIFLFVENICEIIMKAARYAHGRLGDEKIFISTLDECIRIRTGEKGSEAI